MGRPGRCLSARRPTRHWPPLCRALGLDALIDDPRYVDTAARAENNVALHAAITEAIKAHDLAELRDMLKREDTIFSALQSPLETIDDPQVVENGYLAPHPTHPTARVACAPMQFDDERITIERLDPRFTRVGVRFGFMEDPNLSRALALCRRQGLKFDVMTTSFFLSRRKLLPEGRVGMPLWQDHIYINLAAVAADPSDFYRLPRDRVVELGSQMAV